MGGYGVRRGRGGPGSRGDGLTRRRQRGPRGRDGRRLTPPPPVTPPYRHPFQPPVTPTQGAGGVITDWRGQPLRWHPEGVDAPVTPGEVLAAGDARVHEAAMRVLDFQG
jgi:hypothetical protein